MSAYDLLTVYNLKLEIGVSESMGVWTYAELADGIDNVAEALHEVVQQYFFLSDKGFARNHVTGMAPTFTITGRRVLNDTAQDFIFGAKYGLDTDRQTSLKLTNVTEGKGFSCDATIANVQEYSGASTDDSAISFEIRLDGQPTAFTVTP